MRREEQQAHDPEEQRAYMSLDMRELLGRLTKYGYLCWNGPKFEGPAHDLIMLGYAEGRRPPRHRNWYIDITPEGREAAKPGAC